jgi:transposase IS4-like protein
MAVWTPGKTLAVDEIIVRYEGHAKETTTVPNKPTPTGFKVWGVAQRGFLICWNWHIPGDKNGPIGVKTPRELGGTIKEGKGGNKTQAVALHLISRLPKPPVGYSYHVFLDNLFVSTKMVEYARSLGIAVTGTCRDNGGVIQELLDLKKKDKKDMILWGTTYSFPTENGRVCHIGWKDQAFVLMMSSAMSGDQKVLRTRKRPKETSSKAKTAREPFGDDAIKELWIPEVADGYNHFMGAVDEFDHLTAQNPGLRHVVRGGAQALEHWLLRTVLVNCYLLALCSDVPEPREINFRSQQDFRRQLVGALLAMGSDSDISPKRRIGRISQSADQAPVQSHERVKMEKRGECVNCKGLRFGDRPKKRVALGEIAANKGRKSSRHESFYGCKQCDVHLCKNRACFDVFHRES